MKGLILEGIVGSGKSSILRFLRKKITEAGASSLILDETLTERSLEPLHLADLGSSLSHLNRLLHLMKGLHELETSVQRSVQSGVHFLLERFHFSHCLDIAGFDRFAAYADIDKQMQELGSKLVLLTVREDHIREQSVVSTKKFRGEPWSQYLKQLSETEEGAAVYYAEQQKRFMALCHKSAIPSMTVDTTNRDWEEASFQIVDFLNRA